MPAAIAQNQAKSQGADVVGQPLGGVLFATAWLLPFLVDAVTGRDGRASVRGNRDRQRVAGVLCREREGMVRCAKIARA